MCYRIPKQGLWKSCSWVIQSKTMNTSGEWPDGLYTTLQTYGYYRGHHMMIPLTLLMQAQADWANSTVHNVGHHISKTK